MLNLRWFDTIADWACCDTCVATDAFKESDHPRGQPENAGEFAPKGGGTQPNSKQLQPASADRDAWPDHIKKLRVPPAWKDVHINPDPEGALQVLGRDEKGRRQPIYHPRYMASQAAAKFARVKELDQKFTDIKQQNDSNRKSQDPVTREHADVAALIMSMGVRPGSTAETGGAVKAYGATTLQGRHVVQLKGGVRLRFTGKHGVQLDLPVNDPSLAKMLIGRKVLAGPKGDMFPHVSDKSILSYVHSFDGGGFRTKDMRTLLGTRTAMALTKSMEAPTNPTQYKKAVRAVAVAVSNKLGNTPTVALQSYINPTIFAEWRHTAGV
jgi:DNA topoisomerase-1